jgi:hypothetical protein
VNVSARALVLLLLAAACQADVLTLKSGGTVEGIATERGDVIEMLVPGGTMAYRREVVASLKKAPWKAPPPKPAAPKTEAKASAAPAPVMLGGGRPDPAELKRQAWIQQQRERIRKEQESRPGTKVTFEGGDPKCKSYEIYYGPGGKPTN